MKVFVQGSEGIPSQFGELLDIVDGGARVKLADGREDYVAVSLISFTKQKMPRKLSRQKNPKRYGLKKGTRWEKIKDPDSGSSIYIVFNSKKDARAHVKQNKAPGGVYKGKTIKILEFPYADKEMLLITKRDSNPSLSDGMAIEYIEAELKDNGIRELQKKAKEWEDKRDNPPDNIENLKMWDASYQAYADLYHELVKIKRGKSPANELKEQVVDAVNLFKLGNKKYGKIKYSREPNPKKKIDNPLSLAQEAMHRIRALGLTPKKSNENFELFDKNKKLFSGKSKKEVFDFILQYEPTFSTKKLSRKETIKEIEKIPKNIRSGWLRNADANYKPKIVASILSQESIRNATLNLFHQEYKKYKDNNISYENFLFSPIYLYRGGELPTIGGRSFLSFSFDKNIAKMFSNGKITKIKIKPIETYGMLQSTSEGEVLVPPYLIHRKDNPFSSEKKVPELEVMPWSGGQTMPKRKYKTGDKVIVEGLPGYTEIWSWVSWDKDFNRHLYKVMDPKTRQKLTTQESKIKLSSSREKPSSSEKKQSSCIADTGKETTAEKAPKEKKDSGVVGRTWESKEGPREVIGVRNIGGKEMALVSRPGLRGADIISLKDLDNEIAFDEKNHAQHKKMKGEIEARKKKEQAEKEARQDFQGYEHTLTPRMRARMLRALSQTWMHEGTVKTKKQTIQDLVNRGYRVTEHKTRGRLLEDPKTGSHLTQKQVTKLGLDYANHLVKEALKDSLPFQPLEVQEEKEEKTKKSFLPVKVKKKAEKETKAIKRDKIKRKKSQSPYDIVGSYIHKAFSYKP